MLDRTPSRELREDLWVFPMDYPIKLIGEAGDDLHHAVVDILLKHFPDFKKGNAYCTTFTYWKVSFNYS